VLPKLTPATELGSHAVTAYAAYYGMDVASYLASQGPALTTEQAGKSVTELIAGEGTGAFLLTADGLRNLG